MISISVKPRAIARTSGRRAAGSCVVIIGKIVVNKKSKKSKYKAEVGFEPCCAHLAIDIFFDAEQWQLTDVTA
ncbi:hypothetical protein ACFS07_03300 [Undibacterium arcticum]